MSASIEVAIMIDEGIELERKIKKSKRRLDMLKATLTNIAYETMENKNLKYLQLTGSKGRFNTVYKEKFEIDNFNKILDIVGEVAAAKIIRKEETKYEVESRFKLALIAIFKEEYSNEITVDEVLQGMGLDDTAIKMAKKKLTGDYLKDKKVLESLGITGHREEELDAIRLYKNYELVQRFFGDLSPEQIEMVKKAVFVEDGISVGFDYRDDNQ